MRAGARIDAQEYLRLKAENERLLQELRQLRGGVTPQTILGMRDMLLALSHSGEITYVNAAAQTHFGLARESMTGMPLAKLSSADLNGAALQQLAHDAMALRAPLSLEITSPDAAAHDTRSFSVTASPSPTGVQLLISDRSNLRRMESALARYISPQVLDAVLKSGVDPYQARKYELSVLFADLRGFTSASSQLRAEEVKKLIDEYLTVQIDIVIQEGATLDKIVGDEVMALFGAPLQVEQHALWAINTALKMREGHRRLMELWTKRGLKACPLGIGINSGEMVVGHIGSKQQMNYTVLGHSVNLGARLCSAAQGGEILISNRTFQLAKDALAPNPESIWRPVKFVRGKEINAKGISEPVQSVSVVEA
jgi:class 3 adenylate cyclase